MGIRRRRTPYIKVQTLTLMAFQVLPLFLLPYVMLPYAGHNGAFDVGVMKWLADELFPVLSYGQGREYWRAFGFILAWPLFIWNFFTEEPMTLWLIIGFLQTFVAIPAMVYFWARARTAGGSAPAAPWPRRWATPTATRCPTARSGTG